MRNKRTATTRNSLREETTCYECDETFTKEEWQDRHDVHEADCRRPLEKSPGDGCDCGAVVHQECCQQCPVTTSPHAETQRKRRGHAFWPEAGTSAEIPKLYASEDTRLDDKTLWVHYFLGGCDWWIAELNPINGVAFGYACLGDPGCAEWGYVDLTELEQTVVHKHGLVWVVERDLSWRPVLAGAADLPGWRA